VSTKAQEIAAKAARLRAAQQQQATPAPDASTEVSSSVPTEVLRPVVRVKPVRSTLDLPPVEHAELQRHALETAAALGLARVNGQEILRELVRAYLTDTELRAVITRRIAQGRARR
jgi:hypothetical protein